MKVGDLVQMVTGLPGYKTNPRNNGILIDIVQQHKHPQIKIPPARVATVMSCTGEIMTWPLDSNYEIRAVDEDR